MEKNLLKKLKNYSKVAAAMAVVSGSANAQIVYTDVDPDTTLNTFPSNYEIDFDGDSVVDINMNMYIHAGSGYSYAIILAEPADTLTSVVSSNFAAVLNSGDTISAVGNKSSYGFLMASVYYSSNTLPYGNWNADGGQTEKFIGVKFDISGETHYGWIRATTKVNAWNDMSVTIHDFAYQAIADSSIVAGDEGNTAISQVNDLTTNIYPNPVSNTLNIELQKTGNYTLKLTNLAGKEVFVKEINGNSARIDVSELEKANYILTISNGKTITTKQIVIE